MVEDEEDKKESGEESEVTPGTNSEEIKEEDDGEDDKEIFQNNLFQNKNFRLNHNVNTFIKLSHFLKSEKTRPRRVSKKPDFYTASF